MSADRSHDDQTVTRQPSSGELTSNPRSGKNVLVTSSVRGGGLVLTLVANGLLSRTLTPGEFGRFALLTSLLLVLCCIARFGLERTIVRYAAKYLAEGDGRAFQVCFRAGFSIATITTIAMLVVWVTVTSFYSVTVLGFQLSQGAIIATSVMLASGSLLMIASESFRVTRHEFLANLTMAETSSLTIAALNLGFLGLICSWTRNTLDSSLFCLAMAMAIPSLVAIACLPKSIARAQPSQDDSFSSVSAALDYRAFFWAGGLAMLIQTVTNLTLTCDYWFVERFYSPEDLGLFAAAKRLVNLSAIPMSLVAASAAASIAVLHSQGRRLELQIHLRRLVVWGSIPSLLFLLALLLFPTLILEKYYGSGYGQADALLRSLVFGYAILAIVGAAEMSLVMTGNLRMAFLISFLSFAALIAGCVLFSSFGVEAIGWVFSIVLAGRSIAMCVACGIVTGSWSNLAFRAPFMNCSGAGGGNDAR